MRSKMISMLVVVVMAAILVSAALAGGSRPPRGPSPCSNSTQYNPITGECHLNNVVVNNPPVLYNGGN